MRSAPARMFAFAIWDQNGVTCSDTVVGIKPAVLRPAAPTDAGSAELKALLHAGIAAQRPDGDRDYFAGYIPEPRTIFSGVRKLTARPPWLIEKGQTLLPRTNQYWDIPFADKRTGDAGQRAKRTDRAPARGDRHPPGGRGATGGVCPAAWIPAPSSH